MLRFWLGVPWTLGCAALVVAVQVLSLGRIDGGFAVGRVLWVPGLRWIGGVTVDVRGEITADLAPCVIVANHQGFFDGPVMLEVSAPVKPRVIYKRVLRWVPLFGLALMVCRHVAIDRANRERAIRSMRRAAVRIRGGTSILVFPEGTRTRGGEVRPFKRGAFRLAVEAGVPIVPVAIEGSHEVLPRGVRVRPGAIEVHVLDPIETTGVEVEDEEAFDALIERTRRAILAEVDLIRRMRRLLPAPDGRLAFCFAPIPEGPGGEPAVDRPYLTLVGPAEGARRVVERIAAVVEEAGVSGEGALDAEIVELLEESDWRAHLPAILAIHLGAAKPATLAAIWASLEASSWAGPQLAVVLSANDPAFRGRALRRLEEGWPGWAPTSNADKNAYALAGLLREDFGGDREVARAVEAFESRTSDYDGGAGIAVRWRESLRALST